MDLKFKIWLERKGEVVAGDGKVRLLKSIGRHGSIQKAARENGMSYRHAWGALRKMERRSGRKLVATRSGGALGGGARLTPAGREFVVRYARFKEGLAEIVRERFREAFPQQGWPGKAAKAKRGR